MVVMETIKYMGVPRFTFVHPMVSKFDQLRSIFRKFTRLIVARGRHGNN